MLLRCRRREEAGPSPGSERSGSQKVARVSVSARAPRPLAVRLDCALPGLLWGAGGACPGPERLSVQSWLGSVCVLATAAPGPSQGSSALLSPSCLAPWRCLPKPNHLCTRETQLLPLRAPGAGRGQGHAAEGAAAASCLLVASSPSPV